MTQNFSVSIDGTDVTPRVSLCNVSEEMNRTYDVANLTVDREGDVLLGKEVIIHFENSMFTGFIYSISITGKNSSKIECRTYSAKFTEPYSPHEVKTDEAVTSHALCALYASESGIPISITAENLDFGGSYERKGTMLSALLNVASVTGAEYYNDNGTVMIVPNKAIDSEGMEIADADIFDFVAGDTSVYNKGVGTIITTNGEIETLNDDVISRNKIYTEVDECTGEIFVFTNPFGALDNFNGVGSLASGSVGKTEVIGVIDEQIVTLSSAIGSIISVTLNGSNISGYDFEEGNNIMYFTTKQRGTLTVTYNALCYRGYVDISITPLGSFISYDMFYLDQILKYQGILSGDCAGADGGSDSSVGSDGDMTCIVPSELLYPKGFTVWTIGGDEAFTFYSNSELILINVETSNGTYEAVENASLEAFEGAYRYRTRYKMTNPLEAKSAGVPITYTTTTVGDDTYFHFLTYHPSIVLSYQVTAKSHYIEFPHVSGAAITMVITNKNTGRVCEYGLQGVDSDNIDAIPCEFGDIPINILMELSVSLVEARGRVIPVTNPDDSLTTTTVDNTGIAKVTVMEDGVYVLDTTGIKPRTEITLTSRVEG